MAAQRPTPVPEGLIGYAFKKVQAALRSAMDDTLAPLDLSVPQYACLRALGLHPDATNADLARAAFVTRQSMNTVLQALQARGLVERPTVAPRGRSLPTRLTVEGEELLLTASRLVDAVEARMLSPLNAHQQERLYRDLELCAGALGDSSPG